MCVVNSKWFYISKHEGKSNNNRSTHFTFYIDLSLLFGSVRMFVVQIFSMGISLTINLFTEKERYISIHRVS